MKRISRYTVLGLMLLLVVPAAFAKNNGTPRAKIKVNKATIGTVEIPGATGVTLFPGLSNLSGETATCPCPSILGGCTPTDTWVNGSPIIVSTYFTDISNGATKQVSFSSAVQPDGFNVAIFNGVTVTLNESGVPAGEDITHCIYYTISFPAFFNGRTFPLGAGIRDFQNDKVQGQTGVLHLIAP